MLKNYWHIQTIFKLRCGMKIMEKMPHVQKTIFGKEEKWEMSIINQNVSFTPPTIRTLEGVLCNSI